MARARRHVLRGCIASVGFASGDRFVVGHWLASPVGPFTDVMWATARGERLLLVPSAAALGFVTGIYLFDHHEVVPISAAAAPRRIEVSAGPVHIELGAGRIRPIPLSQIAWFCRYVQGPIARRTMGVRTYGVTARGVREWYRASSYRRVLSARASVDGRDLGALQDRVHPPVRFGLSEPPRRPSLVAIAPLLEYPETVTVALS